MRPTSSVSSHSGWQNFPRAASLHCWGRCLSTGAGRQASSEPSNFAPGVSLHNGKPSYGHESESEDECAERLQEEVDRLRKAGNVKCSANAFAEAAKLFSAALKLKPDATQLLVNRGFCLLMTGDPAAADRDFCVALVLERRLPSAYRWRAAARRDCRYMFGAVQDMRMAARMAPTPEKKEAALLEVSRLQQWLAALKDTDAEKRAAEECHAREVAAEALAAEARAAAQGILAQRRADLKKSRAEKLECRKRQAELEAREKAEKQKLQLRELQRRIEEVKQRGEIPILDLLRGTVTGRKGDTIDLIAAVTPREAPSVSSQLHASESGSGSKILTAADISPLARRAVMSTASSAAQQGTLNDDMHIVLFPRLKQVESPQQASEQGPSGIAVGSQPGNPAAPGPNSPAVSAEEDIDVDIVSMDDKPDIGIVSSVDQILQLTTSLEEGTLAAWKVADAKQGSAAGDGIMPLEPAARLQPDVQPSESVPGGSSHGENVASSIAAYEATDNPADPAGTNNSGHALEPAAKQDSAVRTEVEASLPEPPSVASNGASAEVPSERLASGGELLPDAAPTAPAPAATDPAQQSQTDEEQHRARQESAQSADRAGAPHEEALEAVPPVAISKNKKKKEKRRLQKLKKQSKASTLDVPAHAEEATASNDAVSEEGNENAALPPPVAETDAQTSSLGATKRDCPSEAALVTSPFSIHSSSAADAAHDQPSAQQGREDPSDVSEAAADIRGERPGKDDCLVTATLQRAASALEAHQAQKAEGESIRLSAIGDTDGDSVVCDTPSGTATPEMGSADAQLGLDSYLESSGNATPHDIDAEFEGAEIFKEARIALKRGRAEAKLADVKQSSHQWSRKEFLKALELYDRGLKINPTIKSAYLLHAGCFIYLNRLHEAAEAYELAAKETEGVPLLARHANVAKIVSAVEPEIQGTLRAAKDDVLSLLESSLKLSTTPVWRSRVMFLQMEVHLRFGDVAAAENTMQKIFNDLELFHAYKEHGEITFCQRSRVSDAFKLAGNDLQEKKEWDRAKELYSLALQVQPSNIKALSNRALMNLRLYRFEDALGDATEVYNKAKDTTLQDKALRRRADAYIGMSRYQEAINDLCSIRDRSEDDGKQAHALETMVLVQQKQLLVKKVAMRHIEEKEGRPALHLAGMDQPIPLPEGMEWVQDLPLQNPARNKTGGVMPGRLETAADDDALAGCSMEDILARTGQAEVIARHRAALAAAAAATGKPTDSDMQCSGSPTRVSSGPYSPSSDDSSAVAASGRPVKGQLAAAPPADDSAPQGKAQADNSSSNRETNSVYGTAEANSPVSDVARSAFHTPPSEQRDQREFPSSDRCRTTSSTVSEFDCAAADSPIDSPSEVSDTDGDSSDSDSPLPLRRGGRTSTFSFRQMRCRSRTPDGARRVADLSSSKHDVSASKDDVSGSTIDVSSSKDDQTISKRVETVCGAQQSSTAAGVEAGKEQQEAPAPRYLSRWPAIVARGITGTMPARGHGLPITPNPDELADSEAAAAAGLPPTMRQVNLPGGFLNRSSAKGASHAAKQPSLLNPLQKNFFENDSRGIYHDHVPVHKEPERDPFYNSIGERDLAAGMAAFEEKKFHEAMSSLNNAAKYLQLGHPDAYQLHDTLGHCRKIFNDLPGALEAYEVATPLGKKMFEQAGGEGSKLAALHLGHTLCMHAQILEELGRYKEGMKLLGMGVIMMKDNFICREHRAHMLLHHGSKEMAAQDLKVLYEARDRYTCKLECCTPGIMRKIEGTVQERSRKAHKAARQRRRPFEEAARKLPGKAGSFAANSCPSPCSASGTDTPEADEQPLRSAAASYTEATNILEIIRDTVARTLDAKDQRDRNIAEMVLQAEPKDVHKQQRRQQRQQK